MRWGTTREWTDAGTRGTVEQMSRESEPGQSGQRTVADLLAQYGGAQPKGGRRRRRRAEDDSADAPQQIIDRVLSESGRMRAVSDDPTAAPPVRTSHSRRAKPTPESTPPVGYFDAPTGYLPLPLPPADPAMPEPTGPGLAGSPGSVPTADRNLDANADAPTGYLARVPADGEPPAQPGPGGPAEHPAADFAPPRRDTGQQAQQRAEQRAQNFDQPTGYVELPSKPARPGNLGAAAANARDGRAAARASWPVGGLAKPIPADEPMTEQFPRIPAEPEADAPDATQLVSPVPEGLGGPPLDADETAQWYDFATQYAAEFPEEPADHGPASATSLVNPVAPQSGDDAPVDGYYDPDAYGPAAVADSLAAEPRAADAPADERPARRPAEGVAEPEDAGSPLRQWLVMAGQLAGGIVGGAGLWLGFNFLWRQIPLLALVLAAVVTVGLVLGVRKIRQAEDLQTTVLAVLVGLVVTVTPAAFLLVAQ